MRQKKYTLRPLELWDPCAVERWLEDEAALLADMGEEELT